MSICPVPAIFSGQIVFDTVQFALPLNSLYPGR